MEEKYSYHISLHLDFKKDVDVNEIEKHFGIEAYKKTSFVDSKGPHKAAKIWYRSKESTSINTDMAIESFTRHIFEYFVDLKKVLAENSGKATFGLIFTKTNERPIIALTPATIEMFAKLGVSFDVDFMDTFD